VDRALLDTDIFSEILKGRNPNVVAKATQYRSAYGYYSISVTTVLEIVKGFHKLQREDRVQQFLDGLPGVELLTLDQKRGARGADLCGSGARRATDRSCRSHDRRHRTGARLDVGHWQPVSLPTDPSPGLRY
jgi:predicted nucleic acid-binding protein